MKIKNKSWGPLVISLPGGKSLTLPGRGYGEVSDEDFQGPEFQRLAKSRTIIALPGETKKPEETKKSADTGKEPSPPAAGPPEGGGGADKGGGADTGKEPSPSAAGPPEGGGGAKPQ